MSLTFLAYRRLRLGAALSLTLISIGLLWAGFDPADAVFPSETALVEHSPYARLAPSSRSLSEDRSRLLQSSVDSVALSLGGIFTTLPDDEARLTALATALNSLTFELGGEIYFTAWDGTRIVHSPLTPDTENTDFASALDQHGTPFVAEMDRLARTGGGFIPVSLPRRKSACLMQRLPVPSLDWDTEPAFSRLYGTNPVSVRRHDSPAAEVAAEKLRAAASLTNPSLAPVILGALSADAGARPGSRLQRADFAANLSERGDGNAHAHDSVAADMLPGMAPPPAVEETEAVEQLLYVRGIPRSNWHIAAFMPAEPDGREEPGFSPAFTEPSAAARQPGLNAALRKGLLLSGFSLAGLSGLILFGVYRRREYGQ